MELYQIRYFLAVSRTLNFTHAAEECNVTQPALTRAIKKLEEELGGELFRRERARSHLTQLGHAMVPLLEASFNAASAAKAEAETFGRGDVAPLRIGMSETVTGRLLAPIVHEVKRAVPGLRLTITRSDTSTILQALDSADIDFAISSDCDLINRDRLRAWPLFEEDFVICGEGKSGEIASLSELCITSIVSRPYCESEAEIREFWSSAGREPASDCAVSSDVDIAAFLASSGVYALLPKSSAATLGLPVLTLANAAPTRSVSLVEAAGRQHNSAASRFLRLMRSADWPSLCAEAPELAKTL